MGEVRIKPLIWGDDSWREARWTAKTGFDNEYGIAFKDENFPEEQYILWLPEGGKGTGHPSLDEAKAAAQADFENRIRSVLARTSAAEPMADGSNAPMSAAEEVLVWLLVEKIGVPDDVAYSPDQAQKIIEGQIDRAKELDRLHDMLIEGQGDDDGASILPEFEKGLSVYAKVEACLHLLERRRDALSAALSGMAEPRLWFVKDFADGWIAFQDKELAEAEAQATGAMMLLGYQSPPATPPASEREEVERLRKALQEIAQPTVDNSVTYARNLAFKALNPEGK